VGVVTGVAADVVVGNAAHRSFSRRIRSRPTAGPS
jgi:hypothetical protein